MFAVEVCVSGVCSGSHCFVLFIQVFSGDQSLFSFSALFYVFQRPLVFFVGVSGFAGCCGSLRFGRAVWEAFAVLCEVWEEKRRRRGEARRGVLGKRRFVAKRQICALDDFLNVLLLFFF